MKTRSSIILSLIIVTLLVLVTALPALPALATVAATTIVYNAISNTLPPNIPSVGFQATQTSEFGDYVHLAGTNHVLKSVSVTMSDWALYSDYSSDVRYAGNSATWSHPITLNIYNVVPGTPLNTRGSLLGTVTQAFAIPWRPVADPTCPGGTAWRAGDGQCYNGFAFNITFDMSSLNVTLPNDIIVGIAYNTGNYGVAPIGVNGPYNSLNVGALGSATVGTDDNTDKVFWNTSTAAWYNDGGAGGVGIFREDTNWTPNGTVNIQITAAPTMPANMSWVKSASPVLANGTCGVSSPVDPSVLVDSGTNYRMYFSNHPNAGSSLQIFLATSTDAGQSWTCGNGGSPVLTAGGAGAWDEMRIVSPSVIKDGATYKMWYTGRNVAGNNAIGYATSADGISWTKYGSNPVLMVSAGAWDSQYVREPAVVNVGGTFHMWYSGTAAWPYFKIGHATSPDGIVWTKDSANPVLTPTSGAWDSIQTYAPAVVMNGSVFEMFYSGNSGGRWMTGQASSADGTTWTKDANAILSPSVVGWDNADSTDYPAAVIDGPTWKLFYWGAGGIGLATLTNQAQLTFRQLGSSVSTGNSTTIYIDLTAVTNLYGYEFQVNYDPSKVTATGALVNSFFDTVNDAFVPGGWNGACAAGVCKFAASKLEPGLSSTGSGTIGQITFTGTGIGEVALTFSGSILTDRNATRITHTTTVGWIDVNGSATVSGVVALQGRATPIDAGTVTLYDQYGYSPAVTVSFDPSTGAWSATVPVNVNDATYKIDAAHSLYLTNQKPLVTVTNGGSFAQGITTLKGGDANNDGTIEIGDLTCVGGAFGGLPVVCGSTGTSDINHDNATNILDLVLVGGNYGLTAPQPW